MYAYKVYVYTASESLLTASNKDASLSFIAYNIIWKINWKWVWLQLFSRFSGAIIRLHAINQTLWIRITLNRLLCRHRSYVVCTRACMCMCETILCLCITSFTLHRHRCESLWSAICTFTSFISLLHWAQSFNSLILFFFVYSSLVYLSFTVYCVCVRYFTCQNVWSLFSLTIFFL